MRVQIGDYSVQVWREELPGHFEALSELAGLSELFGDLRGRNDEDGSLFCVSVSPLGAGTRLLAYRLGDPPVRLWEDTADFGFWWWDRQGEVILMAAECELAAWNLHGRKLWSTWAEPPWSSSVQNRVIQLDVMDNPSAFPVASGPSEENPT